ncbi:MAG: radical SAM protein [Candidatus Eremiobacteraeota bacterium]|nr:radical SAM protein [Candidatus Eremiobacteraeota bacterium]
MPPSPRYLKAYHSGMLRESTNRAYALLARCRLCARFCEVDRTAGEKGYCSITDKAVVSSYGPHFGEESPLVGHGGSGTLFLTSCNLLCTFCQNYEISHLRQGEEMGPRQIARIMLSLQRRGCHNINFVTPSHQLPFLLDALGIAAEGGLTIPLVWNCGGYESMESLSLLDGIIDIFMPDFKFWSIGPALELLNASDYPEVARKALKEMQRQVGDLVMDEEGIAFQGLLIRHLVMPENICGTEKLLQWIARELSPSAYVNLMAQYRPCFRAGDYGPARRGITDSEYRQALLWGREQGLRLDTDSSPRHKAFRIWDFLDNGEGR